MDLKQKLDYLFNPRSIALVGASSTFGKWGFNILSLLISQDGGREIYAVNKKEAEILGQKTYRSMSEVPRSVDLAVITVPYQDIPAAMEECVQKGVKSAVVISGGLAETGAEGAEIQERMVEIARQGGFRFVGPNCMGHFDAHTEINTVIFLPPVDKGPISLVSQSGNSGQSIIYMAAEAGLGISKYISSGNEADLQFEDYIEYLAQDDTTAIILAYIEGIRDGRRFMRLAREVTRKKPIVIMKAGRTEAGARAARSHTASLAGSDVICDAAFKQAGVIRVDEITELIDVSMLLLGQPLPRGRRVGVLSGGGGAAVMAADALKRRGLEVPSLSPITMEKLNEILSRRWSHGNPVDPGGDALNYECLWALIEDENLDITLAIGAAGMAGSWIRWYVVPPTIRAQIDEYMVGAIDLELKNIRKAKEMSVLHGKPVVMSNVCIPPLEKGPVYRKLEEEHMLPFLTPERAARAIAHVVEYSEYLGIAEGGK